MKNKTFVPCCTPITKENYNKMLPFLESTGIEIYESYDSTNPNETHLSNVDYRKAHRFVTCGENNIKGIGEEVSNFQFLINSGVELTLQDVYIEVNDENRKEVIEFINETCPNYKVEKNHFISEVNNDLCLFFYEKNWYTQYGSGNKIQATIQEVKEYFGKEEKLTQEVGKKETTNKTKYELDFDFIEAMAKRIESETKYPPYNWQLPINTQDLADALFRHAVEVKKGNFDDDGELGHLMAVANNAMFLYYQKKHHSNELGE